MKNNKKNFLASLMFRILFLYTDHRTFLLMSFLRNWKRIKTLLTNESVLGTGLTENVMNEEL